MYQISKSGSKKQKYVVTSGERTVTASSSPVTKFWVYIIVSVLSVAAASCIIYGILVATSGPGNQSTTTARPASPFTTTTTEGDRTSVSVGPTTTTTVGDKTSVSVGPTTTTTVRDKTSVSVGPTTTTTVGDRTSVSVGPTTTPTVGDRTSVSVGPTTTYVLPPGWSPWSVWGECSQSCDDGQKIRTRKCQPIGTQCQGSPTQSKPCIEGRCPSPDYGEWSSWSGWSSCSVTCGVDGVQSRTRVCDKDVSEELDCPGSSVQPRDCNRFDCPSCGNRVCPDGGVGQTPDCVKCVCSGKKLTAKVTSMTNSPLSMVSISDADVPNHKIADSNTEGWFTITDACNGIMLQFTRPDYVMTTAIITPSLQTVKMERIEYLGITIHPEDKNRLVGNSVKLCCEFTGSPGPNFVEWFKDGIIVESDSGAREDEFIIDSVTTSHSGYYQCRASNDYSAVMSDEARLKVRDYSSSFCSVHPGGNIITLPSGCEQEDGSLDYDIGGCNQNTCPGNNGGSSECAEKGKYCCGPTKVDRIDIQCRGFELPVYLVTKCGCLICSDPAIFIIGFVKALDTLQPIPSPIVLVNGSEIKNGANSKGEFVIEVPGNTRHITITAIDTKDVYAESTKVIDFPTDPSKIFYVNINLLPFNEQSTIDSNSESIISVGDGEPFAQVYIPANSIYTESGNLFSGRAKVFTSVINANNYSSVLNSPGQFSYIDVQGNLQRLKTYGMFAIKLNNEVNGEKLQFKEKIQIALDASLVQGEEDSDGNTLAKLWSLNTKSGLWEMSGSMLPENSSYPTWRRRRSLFSGFLVGDTEIPSGRLWTNFDANEYRACYAKVRLFKDNSFSKNAQLDGGSITLLSIDKARGSASTVYADVSRKRARSDSSDKNGYCVIGFCDLTAKKQTYSGFIIAEYKTERLFGANESHPRHEIGMENAVSDALNYKYVTNEKGENPGIQTEFAVSLITEGQKTGPLYNWTGSGFKKWAYSDTCSKAEFGENHYRFYLKDILNDTCTDPPFYTNSKIPQCIQPPGFNFLSWFSTSYDRIYEACYIKILVEKGQGFKFHSKSRMGNCSHPDGTVTKGDIYGVDTQCISDNTEESLCLEFKHPSHLTDKCESEETCTYDETLLVVGQIPSSNSSVKCKRTEINPHLDSVFSNKMPNQSDKSLFQMYMDADSSSTTHLFGIYCHRDNNRETADQVRERARILCSLGKSNDLKLIDPMTVNNKNWAVKFKCN